MQHRCLRRVCKQEAGQAGCRCSNDCQWHKDHHEKDHDVHESEPEATRPDCARRCVPVHSLAGGCRAGRLAAKDLRDCAHARMARALVDSTVALNGGYKVKASELGGDCRRLGE